MYFHYFEIIYPWIELGPSFEQIWILITQEGIVPNLAEISPVVLEKKIFEFVNGFSLFGNYLPWIRAGHFIWTNLNPLHQRMHCIKFGWNWSFYILSLYFHYFVIISLWKRVGALHYNKFESPSPKNGLY